MLLNRQNSFFLHWRCVFIKLHLHVQLPLLDPHLTLLFVHYVLSCCTVECVSHSIWCVKVYLAVLFLYSVQKNKQTSVRQLWIEKYFNLMLDFFSSAVHRASVSVYIQQCDTCIVTPQMNLYRPQETLFWFHCISPEQHTFSTMWQKVIFIFI